MSPTDARPSAATPSSAADSPDTAAFLGEVPGVVVRGILWLLGLLLVTGVAWAWFSKVDVVIVARGSLRPERPDVPVVTTVAARVREIRVREGDRVKRGDLVCVVDSRVTAGEVGTLQEAREARQRTHQDVQQSLPLEESRLEEQKREERRRADSLTSMRAQVVSEHASRRLEARAQLETQRLELGRKSDAVRLAQLDVEEAQRLVRNVHEVLETHRRLANKGLVSRLQMLDLEARYQNAKTQLNRARSAEQQARKALSQQEAAISSLQATQRALEADLQRREEDLRMQAEAARSRAVELDKELALARGRARTRVNEADARYRQVVAATAPGLEEAGQTKPGDAGRDAGHLWVRAPVDGIVAELVVRGPGGMLAPGDVIVRIFPAGSPLVVEALVPNKDVGWLRPGASARIRLDAFPYQRYGSIEGTVSSVSPDAVRDAQAGLAYRIRATMSSERLHGEGRTIELFPGLAAEVLVVTRQERVLETVLAPLRDLRERTVQE